MEDKGAERVVQEAKKKKLSESVRKKKKENCLGCICYPTGLSSISVAASGVYFYDL